MDNEQIKDILVGRGWKEVELSLEDILSTRWDILADETFRLSLRCVESLTAGDKHWLYNTILFCWSGFRESLSRFNSNIVRQIMFPRLKGMDWMRGHLTKIDGSVATFSLNTIESVLSEIRCWGYARLIRNLGMYTHMRQQVDTTVYDLAPSDFYGWEDIYNSTIVYWANHEIYGELEPRAGGVDICLSCRKEGKLQALLEEALTGCAAYICGSTRAVGECIASYPLDSFPAKIREATITIQDRISNLPARSKYNIIAEGPPGTGKTMWAEALGKYLSEQGFVVLTVDTRFIFDLVIPHWLTNLAIIINDADDMVSGEADYPRALSWLDGSRLSGVRTTKKESEHTVITVLTCNSLDSYKRRQGAAMRKGRIDAVITFDQSMTDGLEQLVIQ